MNGRKPVNNKPAPRKSTYHSVPVRTSQPSRSGKPNTGAKYSKPRKKKVPAAVIVTNVLMIGVILSICGVVFAIAYNNIQYDKADAAKNSSAVSSASAAVSSQPMQISVPAGSVSKPVSSAPAVSMPESSPANGELSETFSREYFRNDLFIGDSIFTGLYGYDHLNRANVAAAVGYTPYGAQQMPFDEEFYAGSAVDYAKQFKPSRLIVMLGSNCLTSQTDYDEFADSYKTLLTKLKSVCPDSRIVVISVPPITADSSLAASYSHVTNAIIDTANARIKALCSDLGVKYFDLNSLLKDENGYFNEDYAEIDGLHFLSRTYKVMLAALQEELEKQ